MTARPDFVDRLLAPAPAICTGRGCALGVMVLRVAAGAVIAGFGIGKFTRHAAEAVALDRYGIPWADPVTYLVGALELGGGALLVLGLLTRPVALALTANLAVAIATAGRLEGGPIHLGVAPALLATMLLLLVTGGGPVSLDGLLLARRRQRRA